MFYCTKSLFTFHNSTFCALILSNPFQSGWSMARGWDKQLRTELILEDNTHKAIGKSMQDRLRAAANMLLSDKKESSQWMPRPDIPTKSQSARYRYLQLIRPSELIGMNSSVLGQVNWTHVRNIPYSNTQGKKDRKEKGTRTIAEKNNVRESKKAILNQLKLENIKKENNDNKTAKEVVSMNKLVKRDTNPIVWKKEKTKTKEMTFPRESKNTEKSRNQISTNVPMYHISVIFHWKKMESSSGYPPLRLDQLFKCGYYKGQKPAA